MRPVQNREAKKRNITIDNLRIAVSASASAA